MSRRTLQLLRVPALLGIAVLGLQGRAPAQDAAAALEEARLELQAERERIEAETALLERELEGWVEQRGTLSDRFVDLELEVAAAEGELELLRTERLTARERVAAARRELDALPGLVREASATIVDMLEVLPPSEPGLAPETFGAQPPLSIVDFARRLGELIEASQSSGYAKTRMRLADGGEQEVELGRIGFVAWVFRAIDGDRVGIALGAPGQGELGRGEAVRWYEQLEPEAGAAIGRTMDALAGAALAGAGEAVVDVPIDVTLQMETESVTRPETVLDTLVAGGPVIVPLAVVALLAALLILERVLFLGRRGTGSEKLALGVVEHVRGGRHEQALALCGSKDIPIARTLAACLERHEDGAEAMEDAVQESILSELPRLERFLPTIAMLATVSPLLGLLGTVTGMIVTFEMIATLGSGNPRIMAGGISQALITTAAGLVVAIPILLCHSFLAGRVDRLIADMERFSAVVLNLLNRRS